MKFAHFVYNYQEAQNLGRCFVLSANCYCFCNYWMNWMLKLNTSIRLERMQIFTFDCFLEMLNRNELSCEGKLLHALIWEKRFKESWKKPDRWKFMPESYSVNFAPNADRHSKHSFNTWVGNFGGGSLSNRTTLSIAMSISRSHSLCSKSTSYGELNIQFICNFRP